MSQLDDRGFVTRHDASGMLELTKAFPEQCRRARSLADSADLPAWESEPAQVLILGMGGSAAGGDLVRCLFDAEARRPLTLCRDYDIPSWVSGSTLVFAVSYSGNTEETLAAYLKVKERGAQVICVTSGGLLAQKAQENGDALVVVPSGQPPRTALGWLMMPVHTLCIRLGLLPEPDWKALDRTLEAGVAAWGESVPESENPAKQLAQACHEKPIVLHGLGDWQGAAAYRWKGQICENAKCLAFAHTYPELCHNEILGWRLAGRQSPNGWALITLRGGETSPKMEERARKSVELIGDTAISTDAHALGDSLIEQILSLVLLGDFTSLYLAALNEVDPENIDEINELKKALADVPF